jgi:hypothetical protein
VGILVIDRLLDESEKSGVPFTLSVLKTNRAINLYKRLGCVIDGENLSHYFMSWRSGKDE